MNGQVTYHTSQMRLKPTKIRVKYIWNLPKYESNTFEAYQNTSQIRLKPAKIEKIIRDESSLGIITNILH